MTPMWGRCTAKALTAMLAADSRADLFRLPPALRDGKRRPYITNPARLAKRAKRK